MAVSSIGWYIEEPKFRAWFSHEMHAAQKNEVETEMPGWQSGSRAGKKASGPPGR
jgi:hypothetical protein